MGLHEKPFGNPQEMGEVLSSAEPISGQCCPQTDAPRAPSDRRRRSEGGRCRDAVRRPWILDTVVPSYAALMPPEPAEPVRPATGPSPGGFSLTESLNPPGRRGGAACDADGNSPVASFCSGNFSTDPVTGDVAESPTATSTATGLGGVACECGTAFPEPTTPVSCACVSALEATVTVDGTEPTARARPANAMVSTTNPTMKTNSISTRRTAGSAARTRTHATTSRLPLVLLPLAALNPAQDRMTMRHAAWHPSRAGHRTSN